MILSMAHDDLAFAVVVPVDGAGPFSVHVDAAALEIAVIDRGHATSLSVRWDTPGVYMLIEPQADGSKTTMYVGKANSLRKRLGNHERSKSAWRRAIAISRDTSHGFTSTQCGWLEGRLWELLRDLPEIELENRQRPADNTLRSYDLSALDQMVLPVERLLRVLGVTSGLSVAKQAEQQSGAKKRRDAKAARPVAHETKLTDLIQAGLLEVTTELVSRSSKYPAKAHLTAGGEMVCRGVTYPSPSAAGVAVQSRATNGWTFWLLPDGRSLADLRDIFRASA